MGYEFTNQFSKDLKRYGKDEQFLHSIGKRINETIAASSIVTIHGLAGIRGTTVHYPLK